jgi:predicted PolB exonuclease-like 3'-5' exonuclease
MAKIIKEPVVTQDQFKKLLHQDVPRFIIWDIETGPLPDNELRGYVNEKKIKLPKHPGVFNPADIKYGNRGPAKKQELLQERRAEHARKVGSYEHDCNVAREEHFESFREEAPLKAVTNQVLAIGYGCLMSDGSMKVYNDCDTEKNLTIRWATMVERVIKTDGNFFTWNGDRFDIPIMTQKAWKYDVPVKYLLTKYRKMEDVSIDGKAKFEMGNFQQSASLKHAAMFFGVSGKLAGMDGSMFWKVLREGKRDYALSYLWHDIDATYRVCAKMGLLDTPLRVLRDYAQVAKRKKASAK